MKGLKESVSFIAGVALGLGIYHVIFKKELELRAQNRSKSSEKPKEKEEPVVSTASPAPKTDIPSKPAEEKKKSGRYPWGESESAAGTEELGAKLIDDETFFSSALPETVLFFYLGDQTLTDEDGDEIVEPTAIFAESAWNDILDAAYETPMRKKQVHARDEDKHMDYSIVFQPGESSEAVDE